MSKIKNKTVKIWEEWPGRKKYGKAHLELYYQIRIRNLEWLTSMSSSLLPGNTHPRILKTDLWDEAKKDGRFFVDADGPKVGIDISSKICEMTRSRYGDRISIIQGSIEALPFQSDRFDILWDISTIDHSDNPEQAIKEYGRVLKPGGVLLMAAENPFCFSYPVTKLQSFLKLHVPFKGYLPSRMIRACRDGDLQVIDSFKTNVHLPTFIVYPLERSGRLEGINRGRNFFWNLCKKYFVVLARKP